MANSSTSLRTRKRLIVGNWKMYIESLKDAQEFATTLRRKARSVPGVEVFLAPPFTLIPAVVEILDSSPINVGAQTVSPYAEQKHTGDISAPMLKEAGIQFVIVGHSERRSPPAGGSGDTDALVHAQLERTLEAGLVPILCIGESEREESGGHFSVIETQLASALSTLLPKYMSKVVIAYEPVWAIGKSTEDAMKPSELQQMTIFIKKTLTEILGRPLALKIPILYGGSVDADNAEALLAEGGVNGFLVGRASTQIESFLEIIKATRN